MEHRAHQWSQQGHAVPPLSPDATAYRLGGFGTTEIVLYFDLVRALLAEAWELTSTEPQPARSWLMERLAERRDTWLHEPNETTGPFMVAAELIESERRRLPVTGDMSHLDCDCPLCQALADGELGGGPMFQFFDGHHLELEDEFAFSLCATQEEWDRQQEEYRQFAQEMDRKQAERAAAGEDEFASAWEKSFLDGEAPGPADLAPLPPLLALGFPLAELTSDLQPRPAGLARLRSLNEAYRRLRQSQDAAVTASAAQEFRDLLEAVCAAFPDLTAKCADLQSRLDEVLRRQT